MISPAPLACTFADAAALDVLDRVALLGGKGASLVRMTELGLSVPPGFILTTAACRTVFEDGWSTELDDELSAGISWIEQQLNRRLGDPESPLLVSVRSGAPVSMPGMMDTVLNAGMTDAVAEALSERSGNSSFGWDTALRFVQSYGAAVGGAPTPLITGSSARRLETDGGRRLSPDALASMTRQLREGLAAANCPVPGDPRLQIRKAVQAVFDSWKSDRAEAYRRVEGIDGELGTAVTIQAMTFGNLGERSGTGVAFTRDPSTGAAEIVGEFLPGAQGEDVVSGTHVARPLAEMQAIWPETAGELVSAAARLERDLGDMADIEFTVEEGVLWFLQVRQAKRSPRAALRIAIDMAEDPDFPLDRAGALERVAAVLADPPTEPGPETSASTPEPLAEGLAASPGRAVGALCTDVGEAIERAGRGESVVLIRPDTSPADIAGIAEARGLVTALGGMACHAAVVARSWGIPAVVGATTIGVEADGITVTGTRIATGKTVTVDGDRGLLLPGSHPGNRTELEEVRTLRAWRAELERPDRPRTEPRAHGLPNPVEVRRVVGLKGAATADSLVETLGCRLGEAAAAIDALIREGAAERLPGERVRLAKGALAELDALYRRDSSRLQAAIEPVLDDFGAVDRAFKQLVTSWQIREVDGVEIMNDHTDEAYDAEVVKRLRYDIHGRILAIVATVASAEPRLARYEKRFKDALEAVQGGEVQMMAHPLCDSYHTIWFEFHEELIRLSGRDRESESAKGLD